LRLRTNMVVSHLRQLALCLLLVCTLAVGSAEEECEEMTNLAVVIEAPEPGEESSVDQDITTFMATLEEAFEGCLKYRLWVAKGAEVLEVPKQFMTGMWFKNQMADPAINQLASKKTLGEILDGFYTTLGVWKDAAPDHESRRIVVIATSKGLKEVHLKDSASSLMEESAPVIAVGVGDGRGENLARISFDTNRVVRAEAWSDLGDPESKAFSSLVDLINDPDYITLEHAHDLHAAPKIAVAVPVSKRCTKPVLDIAFVIDSSGSMKLDYQDELFFVQKIAQRFGLSEDGHHAGAVVFSDKGYIDLHIKLDEFYDTDAFNAKIRKARMFGYRTRIDEAFRTVEEQLFVTSGGVRDGVRKVIFLITDGRQNPEKDLRTGEIFDPVKASQRMYDKGIQIFAVGIGRRIVKEQLNAITRTDGSAVYYADDIEELIKQEFVDSLSAEVCVALQPPKAGNLAPATCEGGGCGGCCGNVYINIFQEGSGSAYVLQGMQVGKDMSADSLTGTHISGLKSVNGKDYSTAQIMEVISKALPNDPGLSAALEKFLGKSKRRRRSVDEPVIDAVRQTFVKAFIEGNCGMFVALLQKHGLVMKIDHHVNELKNNVTVFCPVNSAAEKINDMSPSVVEILKRHVSLNNDGFVYRNMDGEDLQMMPSSSGMVKVENAYVRKTFAIGNMKVITIDRPIKHQEITVQKFLKTNKNTRIMGELMARHNWINPIVSKQVSKVCFTSDICVNVAGSLKQRIQNVLNTNKYTLILPTDNMFTKMVQRPFLKKMFNDRKLFEKFVSSHMFIGNVNVEAPVPEILQPISENQPISLLQKDVLGQLTMLSSHHRAAYKVVKTAHVKEGTVLVVQD